jgi:hypothetical protein
VALRLYTGFAYGVINASLRAAAQPSDDDEDTNVPLQRALSRTSSGVVQRTGSESSIMTRTLSGSTEQFGLMDPSRRPLRADLLPDHSFTVTASTINSGLQKLTRVTNPTRLTCRRHPSGRRLLYRGLSKIWFEEKLLLGADSHQQDGLALIVLKRLVNCFDADLLGAVLRHVPGSFCPEDQDGNFTDDQIMALRNRLSAAMDPSHPRQAKSGSQSGDSFALQRFQRVSSAVSRSSHASGAGMRDPSSMGGALIQVEHEDASPLPGFFELDPGTDVSSLIRALEGLMDEAQLRALIAHGLKELEGQALTDLESSALASYSASRRERSFVDAGFSSATPDLLVALEYATNEKCSTLLEIETGDLDTGASLAWISQFPGEDEHTFLALSSFEVIKLRRQSRNELEEEGRLQREESRFLKRISDLECMLLHIPAADVDSHEHEKPEDDNDETSAPREISNARHVYETRLMEERAALEQLRETVRESRPGKSPRIRFQEYVNVITVSHLACICRGDMHL